MPENPDSERFIRFADFCRDPLAHPLKTASGKIKISHSVLPITVTRIALGIQCGWSRTNGRAMPNQNSCRYFLPSGAPPAQPAELQFSARIVRGSKP
ncbi:hypothetical protein ACLB1S_29320 [Escherichia coli]